MIGILSTDNIADLKPLGDRLLVEVRWPKSKACAALSCFRGTLHCAAVEAVKLKSCEVACFKCSGAAYSQCLLKVDHCGCRLTRLKMRQTPVCC